jgi:L-2-hydroxyglutarate oxidase LhgO
MLQAETVVVGAGIVGLATARALALAGREVLVIEAADQVGTETSSRNSEVIHSGLYYPTGSLKARLCVDGRERLYAYCAARSIPHRRTGKLIVAVSDAELEVLEQYRARARANGVGDLPWLTTEELRSAEPALEVVGAIRSPVTGIVDSHALLMSLWADLESAGGTVALRCRVLGGSRAGAGFVLDVAGFDERLQCRELVNSAGLSAPALARALAGCAGAAAPTAYYARGHYYSLSGPAPFRTLVYPVAEHAGLGIHVTLDLAGQVRFGPDVEWVDAVDYRFDPARRQRFAAAIRRYYPGLDESRLQPGYVGVRPKIAGPAAPAADFRIDGPEAHGIAGLVHLFGIESPGLTASLAIAEAVRRALA